MTVNLTAWTFNDRFVGFTHPFSAGSPITRAPANSKIELNESLALNPAINDRPTRSISFVAIHSYDIAICLYCTMKHQRHGHRIIGSSKEYEFMNREKIFYKTKMKRK